VKLASSLREHLKNEYHPSGDAYDHERLSWCIQEYFSHRGMEWTADDFDVLLEYDEDPWNYLGFDQDQEIRIDEVYGAVHELIDLLITRPEWDKQSPVAPITFSEVGELADLIAEVLTKSGRDVYFPVHVEVGDEAGTEYISDYFERRKSDEG
jgi:hypothetical protein